MSDEKPELSPRTQAALDKAGIHPDDAAEMSHEDLSAIPGIGPVAVAEIKGTAEGVEVEHYAPTEAEEADTVHHPVADPPEDHPPMVPQGTRSEDEYGQATHPERINPPQMPSHIFVDANGRQWVRHPDGTMSSAAGGPVHQVVSYAADDHPEGVRWPYVTTRPSFRDDRQLPGGSLVWLLPHEVSAFHRLEDRARFKELGVPGF